jgi:A/G-specific adenine glycosylase
VTGELLAWYRRAGRDLPWRRTRDPWAILVSEMMLQQTQAARVVPYYERFLGHFPTPAACAEAPAADVLRLWSGLGYNRRGLALHRAAGVVAREGWPDDLRELPGVGQYTASAVGSFAFGRLELARDVNVARVLRRTGWDVRAPRPEVNQALMELGATVCVARTPRCEACPVAECPSRGTVEPAAPAHKAPRFEDTDRYVRGRVLATLTAGEPWPDVGAERLDRAVAGLVRDGLLERRGTRLSLPGDRLG